jgi:hypothetical protein
MKVRFTSVGNEFLQPLFFTSQSLHPRVVFRTFSVCARSVDGFTRLGSFLKFMLPLVYYVIFIRSTQSENYTLPAYALPARSRSTLFHPRYYSLIRQTDF